MLLEAIGVRSNWGFHGSTLRNRGRSMEWDRVWLELTGVGVIGRQYDVGSHAGHMISCPRGLGMSIRP